jgi:gluconolactonase
VTVASGNALAAIVGDDARIEPLASGFQFTEGPVWDARHGRLLFSDIPGNATMQWRPGGTSVFRTPSNMANGLALDREGRLLCCEHATSRLTRIEPDGSVSVLARAYRGVELNSPNDVVVGSDGTIWFTDPTYGRNEYYGVPRAPQLGFRGVYRVAPDGSRLTLLADDFAQPNGLCFSADERLLFVNDTERMHIRVFEVQADGTLASGRIFATLAGEDAGAPDGMKFDGEGRLYCCGPGGIHVFDAGARCLGVIRLPQPAANFAWGEDDRRSLFITAGDTLFRIRVRVPGRASRADLP